MVNRSFESTFLLKSIQNINKTIREMIRNPWSESFPDQQSVIRDSNHFSWRSGPLLLTLALLVASRVDQRLLSSSLIYCRVERGIVPLSTCLLFLDVLCRQCLAFAGSPLWTCERDRRGGNIPLSSSLPFDYRHVVLQSTVLCLALSFQAFTRAAIAARIISWNVFQTCVRATVSAGVHIFAPNFWVARVACWCCFVSCRLPIKQGSWGRQKIFFWERICWSLSFA